MKTYLLLILSFFCARPLSAAVISADADHWLDSLDRSLDRREQFDRQRTDAIQLLMRQLSEARKRPDNDLFDLNYALYDVDQMGQPRFASRQGSHSQCRNRRYKCLG